MKKIIISILSILTIFSASWVFAGTTLDVEYFIAANSLAEQGFIKKQEKNENYKVNEFVLRQEIALISRRVSWVPANTVCKNIFSDLSATKPNDWACKNIEALVDNNLISRNDIFRPEDNISKAEALIMFIRSLGFDFTVDSKSTKTWQEQVVEYSVKKWIVENFSDYWTQATRGWVFRVANFSIEVKQEEAKIEEKKTKKMSDEVM